MLSPSRRHSALAPHCLQLDTALQNLATYSLQRRFRLFTIFRNAAIAYLASSSAPRRPDLAFHLPLRPRVLSSPTPLSTAARHFCSRQCGQPLTSSRNPSSLSSATSLPSFPHPVLSSVDPVCSSARILKTFRPHLRDGTSSLPGLYSPAASFPVHLYLIPAIDVAPADA